MSTPTNTSSSSKNQQRLMLDVQASDTTSVPYEVFESSQGQLREAAVALSKHKSSLASALGEVNNLRAMVGALERNVETLNIQNQDLFDKLRESRKHEEVLLEEVAKLTETTEFLSHQLQQHAKTSATRYTQLLEQKEETEARLRLQIDRLSNQLMTAQHPQTRVIPWSYTFKQSEHPAHVVKLIVQADANRENRMMRLQLPATTGGTSVEEGGNENMNNNISPIEITDLEKLLNAANDSSSNNNNNDHSSSNAGFSFDQQQQQQQQQLTNATNDKTNDIFSNVMKSSGFAEDAQSWRNVCRRLHQVLSERRHLLRTKTDGPLEFLLRTRQEMAAAIVQMREDAKKLNVVLNTMLEKMAGKNAAASNYYSSSNENNNNNNSNNNNTVTLKMFEGSIEILQTALSDLNHTIQRAIHGCLTDADRVLLGLSTAPQLLNRKSNTVAGNANNANRRSTPSNSVISSSSNHNNQQQQQRSRPQSVTSSSVPTPTQRNSGVFTTATSSSGINKRDML